METSTSVQDVTTYMGMVGMFDSLHELHGVDRGDGDGKRVPGQNIHNFDDSLGRAAKVEKTVLKENGVPVAKLKIKWQRLNQSFKVCS